MRAKIASQLFSSLSPHLGEAPRAPGRAVLIRAGLLRRNTLYYSTAACTASKAAHPSQPPTTAACDKNVRVRVRVRVKVRVRVRVRARACGRRGAADLVRDPVRTSSKTW